VDVWGGRGVCVWGGGGTPVESSSLDGIRTEAAANEYFTD